MQHSLIKNSSNRDLIIFMLGWGLDSRPFMPLINDLNVLFVYDYTNSAFSFDFSGFSNISLIAYSAGVMMTSVLADSLPPLHTAVAVNGTVDLLNEQKGLPAKMIKAFRGLTLDNYMDFRRTYLVQTPQELEKFAQNQPLRTIEDATMELDALEWFGKLPKIAFPFNKILIADDDSVIPTANQIRAWAPEPYHLIKGRHFPFYRFNSLTDILA